MAIKWSIYNSYYPSIKHKNMTIISNSISKGCYMLGATEIETIKEFIETGQCHDETAKTFISELYLDRLLIQNSFDEEKTAIEILHRDAKAKVAAVYFIPTFQCNFACSYCVAGEVVHQPFASGLRMSKKTIEQTAIWLIKTAIANEWSMMRVILFGGEPLVALNENIQLVEYLGQIKPDQLNIEYMLITNGYLLTEDRCNMLVKYKINTIQITLDGPKNIHDNRRVLVNHAGTFDNILMNLINLRHKQVSVVLRINVDNENAPYIADLLQTLAQHKIYEFVSLQFAPVDPTSLSNINGYDDDSCNAYKEMYMKAFEIGFKVTSWKRYCSIRAEFNLVVDPQGYIYKCSNYAGQSDKSVGHVSTGFTDKLYDILSLGYKEMCKLCSQLGNCNGGCVYIDEQVSLNIGTETCFYKNASEKIEAAYLSSKYDNSRLVKTK